MSLEIVMRGRRDARGPLLFCLALAVMITLGACGLGPKTEVAEPMPVPSSTPNLPPVGAEQVASRFAAAWTQGDWAAMYSLLTAESKSAIPQEKFIQTYRDIYEEATIVAVQAEVAGTTAESAQQVAATLHVTMAAILIDQIRTTSRLTLQWDGQSWGIAWTPAAIFEGLEAGLLVKLWPIKPQRGNIYARDGLGLALQDKLITVGVVPAWIGDEEAMLDTLSAALGMPREEIKRKYDSAPQEDWFMPVADITPEQSAAFQQAFASHPGIRRQEKTVRAYPNGAIASHVVGHIGQISAEELEQGRAVGYRADDLVGKAGIERWAEGYLTGRRGGILSIISADGRVVKEIARQPSQPSQSVYLTLDPRLQETAHEALGDRAGAIVALDPYSGEILALVSHPTVDADALSRGMSPGEWLALLDNPAHPLLNRASQGLYPPGSVFKIVTMAAALEEGGFSPRSIFFCGGTWNGLHDGLIRTCWWAPGHGNITLEQGLTESCDVVFYELGKALDAMGPNLLPSYARKFGLGQLTGIQGLDELPGLVPDAKWKDEHPDAVSNRFWTAQDAVNLAIGQGYLLVTPLQAARLAAAVGNGGILYRPRIVRQIMSLSGTDTIVFETTEVGRLPVSAEHLAVIRESLRRVCMSPRGTAYPAFEGVQVPMAGKTGTAETGREETHAWFVGYAPADEPRIAIAVVVEYGGEGGSVAAPIFRQLAERYLGITSGP